MHTKRTSSVAVFFFAHQDDEFGVLSQIEQELKAGRRVRCVYVTDGSATADPDIRNAESLKVLQKLGIPSRDVIFAGQQLSINDGKLHLNTSTLANWLRSFVKLEPIPHHCFIPAWEGGHPDHDLTHAIIVESLAGSENIKHIWQYPLYNGKDCFGPFFRLLSPLTENGPVVRSKISWQDRLRYVRLCLAYPSQWRTWIGLFPSACLHYLFKGEQRLQHVDRERLHHPPHVRPLYYERRSFLDWHTLRAVVKQLKNQ